MLVVLSFKGNHEAPTFVGRGCGPRPLPLGNAARRGDDWLRGSGSQQSYMRISVAGRSILPERQESNGHRICLLLTQSGHPLSSLNVCLRVLLRSLETTDG
jgi:hypothetical protein